MIVVDAHKFLRSIDLVAQFDDASVIRPPINEVGSISGGIIVIILFVVIINLIQTRVCSSVGMMKKKCQSSSGDELVVGDIDVQTHDATRADEVAGIRERRIVDEGDEIRIGMREIDDRS